MKRRDLLAGITAIGLMHGFAAGKARAVEPILTLRGKFGKGGSDGEKQSSLADLDALPQTSFTTTTPWHDGEVRFSGVSVKDYLSAMGAGDAKELRLVALNDYTVDAEIAFLIDGEALLATRQNGEPMPVSDKGPVFVIFPFDSRSELKHQTYLTRCVWQLTEIDLIA